MSDDKLGRDHLPWPSFREEGMTSLRPLMKDYVAPSGPTTGIGGYALEGRKKINRKKADVVRLIAKVSIDWKANEAATSPNNRKKEPTDAQISAGNYAKGHISVGGIAIAIENPAGSKRGPEWPVLKSHYGYIKRTTGADGDHVDAFVKPATPLNYGGKVFVIDQFVDNAFDEHKVMLGWNDEDAARHAYLENYQPGWNGLKSITAMSIEDFKLWLKDGDTTAPVSRTSLQER
jgi:hypothetical protein